MSRPIELERCGRSEENVVECKTFMVGSADVEDRGRFVVLVIDGHMMALGSHDDVEHVVEKMRLEAQRAWPKS